MAMLGRVYIIILFIIMLIINIYWILSKWHY